MINSEENARDLASLVVPCAGRLVSTLDQVEPYRLLDADGELVEPAAVFLRELLAAGRSAGTLRSYGMDLLRWWRFLHAVKIAWDRATRLEARDFSCWIQVTMKQRRLISRGSNAGTANVSGAGAPNPVTGKPALGDRYAPATVAHSVLVTWNLTAVEISSLRYDHGLRSRVGHGGVGGEVAGARPSRAGGCLASGVG